MPRNWLFRVLIVFFTLLCGGRLAAQSDAVSSLVEQYAPTPRASEEIRRGNVSVNQNTGAVSLEISVGEYSDRDFTIPVTLYYSYDGYQARTEAYSYDGFERLTGTSAFIGGGTSPVTVNVEDGITYDAMGNVTALTRHGPSGTAAAQLSMTYSGNHRTQVTDSVTGYTWTGTYREDGTLMTDGRAVYSYADNLIGLVSQVAQTLSGPGGDELLVSGSYTYLPDGTKTESGSLITRLYRGSVVYKKTLAGQHSLETLSLPDVIVSVTDTVWTPLAMVTDHLGSIRAVVSMKTGGVVERNDYYTYGTRITKPASDATAYPSLSTNRWRYAAKEEQGGVTGIPYYDFGARQYDPFTASWLAPDPLAGDYPGISPYVYCAGNPVNIVDKDGNLIDDYYSSLNGIYLGSDVSQTDNMRLISVQDYQTANNLSSINPTLGYIFRLFSSRVIQYDESSFQTEAQIISDNSNKDKKEHQKVFVLDRSSATIILIDGPTGNNNSCSISAYPATSIGVYYYDKPGGVILIGQMHGHPESIEPNTYTLSSASSDDVNSAISFNIPIIGIDAMGRLGKRQPIHLVTPDGTIYNNIGRTQGKKGKVNKPGVNFAKTIMQAWGNRKM